MEVSKIALLDFVRNSDAVYEIPPYQRPYSWDLEQCEELVKDINKSAAEGRSHFTGAILYKEKDGKLQIIDGQQRVLTMLLLLSALSVDHDDLFDDQGVSGEDSSRNSEATGIEERIIPSRRDRRTYVEALNLTNIDESDVSDKDSNDRAKRNKAFFLNMMGKEGFDAERFWEGLNNLIVVAAKIDEDDDSQAIFESFNSKGVSLNTADLIRNYLLMSRDHDGQIELYERYWEPSQGVFGDDPGSLRMNTAVKAWTTVRCKAARAKSDTETFNAFKRYAEDEYDGQIEDLMDELYGFCKVWAENYRYHAVKKFRSSNWAKLGHKTLVSDRERKPASKESWDFYVKHFGIADKRDESDRASS